MLELITGHSGSGKTARVTERIRADIAAGRYVYLVVPEQQTVAAERQMADCLPPSAPLCFEVTNFTRLCDTVFRRHGGLAGRHASPAVEQLLMWRTLTELAPLLRNRIRPEPNNVAKMRSVVRELRTMKMTPAVLSAAALHVNEPALRDKLTDYALISSTYHALLSEKFSDASDRLDRLADLLTLHPFDENTRFYLDNFSSFTEQEYGVISALLPHTNITLTLCVPPHGEKQLCSSEVESTRRALLRLSAKHGVAVRETACGESLRLTDPARAYVAEHLFRADYTDLPPYAGAASDALRLVECPDPADACDCIAADIRRRVNETGARYADFAVVCASSASYIGILDAAFEKNHIPYFFTRRRDLLSLEPIKMIFCAYAIITGGWRREDVIAYLKCSLSGVDPDARDELELYAETWNLRGARWYDAVPWNMNPFGYGEPHTRGQKEYAAEKLARVNAARDTFVPPLAQLGEMNAARHTVTAHVRALTRFLLTLELPERLDERAEELRAADTAAAEEYGRLWDIICDALDSLSSLSGDMEVTTEEFAAQLKMLFTAVKIGVIPATLDEVTVGEARMLRTDDVRYVYLLGANEGEFPPPPAPDISFTEGERLSLSEAGISSGDSLDVRAARELYSFWRALNLAQCGVTVLWSRAGISMEETSPSEPVLRIRHLLGADYPIRRITAEDTASLLYTAAAAGEKLGQLRGTEAGEALKQVLTESEQSETELAALNEPICNSDRTLSPQTAEALWQGDLAMTQTSIQQYKECPFAYFCKYVLKLDNTERAAFNSPGIGTFIHALLEHFFTRVQERGLDPHTLTREQQEEVLAEVREAVIRETVPPGEEKTPRTRVLLASLCQNAAAVIAAVCEEFSHSRFTPAFFELKINPNDPEAPAPICYPLPDGNRIYIYGTIDRVDTYVEDGRAYIRVVDYKTGVKKFSLDDIERGVNLQLLLYLFSLWKTDSAAFRRRLGIPPDGEIIPAAVLYLSSLTATGEVSTPADEATALARAMKMSNRSGLVLDDRAVIDAMDDTPRKSYLPVTVNRDGSYDRFSERSLVDTERLGQLMGKIGELLQELGTSIKHGHAEAAPMRLKKGGHSPDSCAYCAYKPICRFSAADHGKSRASAAQAEAKFED